mgnify:CR=1 FL=1
MTALIQRKVTICMIFIGMSLLGYISYNRLSVELLPNAELPMLFVQIASPSAVSPQYLEQQGVIPVEGAIGTLEGVEQIDTRIRGNQAFMQVSFKQGVRFKYVFLNLEKMYLCHMPLLVWLFITIILYLYYIFYSIFMLDFKLC